MKFRAPTDEPIHVALTNGMTAHIPAEGTELDPMFHREAIARGALPEGVAVPGQAAVDPAFNRKEAIAKALTTMLDGSDPKDFKNDGTPDLRQVSKRVGFQVDRNEVAEAWAEVSAEHAG